MMRFYFDPKNNEVFSGGPPWLTMSASTPLIKASEARTPAQFNAALSQLFTKSGKTQAYIVRYDRAAGYELSRSTVSRMVNGGDVLVCTRLEQVQAFVTACGYPHESTVWSDFWKQIRDGLPDPVRRDMIYQAEIAPEVMDVITEVGYRFFAVAAGAATAGFTAVRTHRRGGRWEDWLLNGVLAGVAQWAAVHGIISFLLQEDGILEQQLRSASFRTYQVLGDLEGAAHGPRRERPQVSPSKGKPRLSDLVALHLPARLQSRVAAIRTITKPPAIPAERR
jgi:hypothetical protein